MNACEDGSDTQKLQLTLSFLKNYTIRHFLFEEALLIQHKYPDYARHKLMHDDFKKSVDELVNKFERYGSSAELSSDVNKVLVRWLVNHIMREDKKIGEYIRNRD